MKCKQSALMMITCGTLILLSACKDEVTEPVPKTGSNSLEPPDGKCLFIIGQADEDAMAAYIQQVRNTPAPAGFAFYTSLSDGAVQGDMPRYKSFMETYPNTILQLAIWTGERQWGEPGYYLDRIVNGHYDLNIVSLAQACKSFGKPIYIRLGYEFDGWHNAYPPDKYIAAYRYFVDKMRAQGVTNVAYVWHSWGVGAYYGRDDFPAYYPALPDTVPVTQALWYPGDDYVDWVALSVFGIGWGDLRRNEVVQWLIAFAVDHDKPVMLAETAAIKTSGRSDPNWVIPNTEWFVNVFNLCTQNNAVKAFTYINVDWEGDNPESTWGDTRIQTAAPGVKTYWLQETESMLHADATLYSTIKFSP
jgi:hypothetical protein